MERLRGGGGEGGRERGSEKEKGGDREGGRGREVGGRGKKREGRSVGRQGRGLGGPVAGGRVRERGVGRGKGLWRRSE